MVLYVGILIIMETGEVRATQIGVTSRENAASTGFNDSVIFGSVKKVHGWIEKILSEETQNRKKSL